jgi:hypothetical protein
MSDLFGEHQEDAAQARDFALRKMRENGGEWHATALLALNLIPGFVGTGEEIRIRLQLRGLSPPHHQNAWGAMILDAIEQGKIQRTGTRTRMRTRKSHGRATDILKVKG